MSGFDIDWLRLREPFDAAARSGDLAARFGAALAHRGTRRIVDLGAGSGANFRALAPVIGGDQDWLLVDDDASLIAAQAEEIGEWSQRAGWRCRSSGADVMVEAATGEWRAGGKRLDLARAMERIGPGDYDGVTTSAFLDLVSAEWLGRLCALLVRHALPLLAALTVDGRREWRPSLPADARIDAAFARHQARDKGFGPALGARAVGFLADRFAERGHRLVSARSDWRIGPEQPRMLLRMVEESAAVARETDPAGAKSIAEWYTQRCLQIHAKALTLTVGHLDLLAIPPAGAQQR